MLFPSVVSDARTGGILQKAIKVFADASIRRVRYALLGDNDHVGGGREPGFVKTEELSEPSLQVVPLYRLSHFLADNDSQTRPTLSVGAQEYQEEPGGIPLPPSRGRKEFPSNEESVFFGKGLVRALASLCFQRVAHRVIRASSGQASSRSPRHRAAFGPWLSDGSRPLSHLSSSYEPEIRAFFFFEWYWADRYVSWRLFVTFRPRANGPHTSSQFSVLLHLDISESEYVLGESAVTEGRLDSAKGHVLTSFFVEYRGTQIPCVVNLAGRISPWFLPFSYCLANRSERPRCRR